MISEITTQGIPWMSYKYTCSACECESRESYVSDLPDGWTTPVVGRMLEHRCPACPYVKPAPPPPPVIIRRFYPDTNQVAAE